MGARHCRSGHGQHSSAKRAFRRHDRLSYKGRTRQRRGHPRSRPHRRKCQKGGAEPPAAHCGNSSARARSYHNRRAATLSQVIESYQKVTYDHGPMMEILPDGTMQISDEHRMTTTRVPVYSFIPFLNTYYLHWVLVIGLGLVTASVVCFAKYRRKIKTKKES